ncbi:hypothetical protein MJD09_24885 [bacterium]|nr:hypothetical protein [bacterium]
MNQKSNTSWPLDQSGEHQISTKKGIDSPSLIVQFGSFGAQHDQPSFYVFNYHPHNIAQNFHAKLYCKNRKLGESKVTVVGYTGPDPATANGRQISFSMDPELYKSAIK